MHTITVIDQPREHAMDLLEADPAHWAEVLSKWISAPYCTTPGILTPQQKLDFRGLMALEEALQRGDDLNQQELLLVLCRSSSHDAIARAQYHLTEGVRTFTVYRNAVDALVRHQFGVEP